MNLAQKLALLIEQSGQTQKAIAAGAGISQASLSNYLSGRIPNTEELTKIAEFFGQPLSYFVETKYPEHKPAALIMRDAFTGRKLRRALDEVGEIRKRLDVLEKELRNIDQDLQS